MAGKLLHFFWLAHSVNCLTSDLNDMVEMAAVASYAMLHCHSQRPSNVLYGLYVALSCWVELCLLNLLTFGALVRCIARRSKRHVWLLSAGDAVVLERWTEDRFKLQMHIIRDASEENIAAVTSGKSKAKRGIARAAGPRVTKPRSPSKRSSRGGAICSPTAQGQSPSKGPSGQGYSSSRGNSSALEALHDAALMCASPASLPSGSQMAQVASGGTLAQNMNLPPLASHGRSMVSAAAVAAADAAALNLEDPKLTTASEIRAEEDGYAQEQGRAAFGDRSLDRISNSISKGVS